MEDSRRIRDIASLFVGRQREMDELTAALNDAMSGRGRLVMLAGEPGIGKTRTARELASYAENLGAQVLWGRCYEDEGTPPYWPWVQAIRSYVQQVDAEQLAADMGPGAAAIAEIVAETRSKLPDLETPPAQEPDASRFRLFDSITTFLTNLAQRQALMLVLDDLHWADRSSLLLLEHLTRELEESRLLLVGCYRDTDISRHHTLAETLAQVSREPVFRRQSLRGLEQDDLGRFVEAASGVLLSQEMIGTLYSHTEGNPFFMTEVVRLLAETGGLTAERVGTPEGLRIPEGVREVIGQRLNRLSERCNEVLTTASIIGREFDFRLLNILTGEISEDELLRVVDEVVSFHLIEEVPSQMDRYQFTHALVQQTLAEEVTTSRRVRLHARIAEGLEEIYGGGVEAHAAELAHHFAEAQTLTGSAKLVRYSLLAGERSLAAYAHEDALDHFVRGLAARDIVLCGTEVASDEEAANLLFGLARAQSATVVGQQLVEAFANLSRAFDYYVETGNVTKAVAAAAFPIVTPSYRIPGVTGLLARALTLVPADSHEAGRILSIYGGFLGIDEGDYEGAQQAFGRAISIARREGDVPLEVQILTNLTVLSGQQYHWQECIDNGLRAIDLATDQENAMRASRWWTAMGFLHMGDLDAGRPHASFLRDLTEKRNTPRLYASNALTPITTLSCLEGDWHAGREYSNRGLEVSPLNPMLLLPRVLLEHETGDPAQGEVYLERLLQAMRGTGPYQPLASYRVPITIAAVARITGIPDRVEIAEATAKAIISERSATLNRAIYAKAGLSLLAAEKGDQSAAKEHYAALLGQRSTMIWTVVSVDRLLGLLSQTMDNLDQAAAHFEEGLTFCRKAGYRPELAWTCCDYADSLLQRDGDGDRAKAASLLDKSLAISTELGMPPLMERVAERLERIQAQPSSAPAYPDGLTRREVEVLSLVAVGKSNADIAEELFISPNTVIRHVSNILTKTDSSNRTEAALYASRHGLAE